MKPEASKSFSRVASIDIGSNAVRLLVGEKSLAGDLEIIEDRRESLRLGKDVFGLGHIRPATAKKLERALKKFRGLCEVHEVDRLIAVGTSALRDADNGRLIVSRLRSTSGIRVQLIDGREEALLLHRAVSSSLDLSRKTSLLVDMGGGSLEVVMSRGSKIDFAESLAIGTVRLLSQVGAKGEYDDFAALVRVPLYRLRAHVFEPKKLPINLLVGTGGNLRSLGKLCYRLGLSKTRNQFSASALRTLSTRLFNVSMDVRMQRFGLRKDRADVILPATVTMLELMRIFEIRTIHVPNVGIKNGLLLDL